MKIICFLRRLPRQYFAWLLISALGAGALLGQADAANLPVSVPNTPSAAKTSATTVSPAPGPDASQDTPTLPTATNVSPVSVPLIQLPLAFSDFAADYHPQALHPAWLTVQVAAVETVFAPPGGKTTFVLQDLPSALTDIYQPVEISCLLGAKSRFDNLTQVDIDPLGHPLGYAVPLGKLVYVLARAELAQGISLSLHYYEAAQLRWLPNPVKDGWFVPVTQATAVTQDLLVPPDGYVFIFLSNRVGPPHPDSTAQPVALYTYLILHVHPVAQPAPALDLPAPAAH